MTTIAFRVTHDAEGLNTGSWPVMNGDLVTPVDRFFTRSHAAVPVIDATSWRLEVDGLVVRPRTFSLEDLGRTFPRRSLLATLVCAGLRRAEFLAAGPLLGELPWGPEAASTGRWTGVALGDVLRAVGVSDFARHVELIGLDQVERHGQQSGFGGSIPLRKALGDEVILASELNGAPIPAVHGFPIRALVPGWIGAKSVKWLGRIRLSEEPSENYFQSKAYRIQREVNAQDPVDVSAGVPMNAVPVNAVIVDPTPNQVVPAGPVRVWGWAMGSEGCPLTAVEVSPNAGRTWIPARIAPGSGAWTWAFWEAVVQLGSGRHILAARATDSTGATQPAATSQTWNVKGYGNNAWYRVAIGVR